MPTPNDDTENLIPQIHISNKKYRRSIFQNEIYGIRGGTVPIKISVLKSGLVNW